MNFPEERYDIEIGLSLPEKTHEAVEHRASRSIMEGQKTPKDFRVLALTMQGVTKDDLPKIQRAFEDTKDRLKGFTFGAQTHEVRWIRGGGKDLKTSSSQKEDGFYHTEQTFRNALRAAGIDDTKVAIQRDPHIELSRGNKGGPPTLVSGYAISEGNRIRWEAAPSEQLTMEAKPHAPPKNSSSPPLRNRQAGQVPQPGPGKPL
jgi:hypothetical protein